MFQINERDPKIKIADHIQAAKKVWLKDYLSLALTLFLMPMV